MVGATAILCDRMTHHTKRTKLFCDKQLSCKIKKVESVCCNKHNNMEMYYRYFLFGTEEGREGPKRSYYICSITNLEKYARTDIELSKAKHVHGKNKDQVEAVTFSKSIIRCIPKNLSDHFTYLQALSIDDCGLSCISKEDLQPFIFLKELFMTNNPIQSLPADLFNDTPMLKTLCVRNNKIQFISQQTLTPLKRLMFADFRGNTKINMVYSSGEISSGSVTFNTLQANIALYCRPADEPPLSTVGYVKKLWQGEFSDFKIIAREEVFAVHKAILAVNSPVFAAMFSHEMEENLESEMTIEHFLPQSVKEFLEFVYLHQIPQKCYNATDLYTMSETYQVKELSEIIQWFIVLEVNEETASEIFNVGVLHNNKVIKEAAFRELDKYFRKKLPEKLMDSLEDMTEILDAKNKLDEVLKRILESYS